MSEAAADAIYHVTSQLQWEHARIAGSYQVDSLLSEGFIHCCRAEQVERIARTFFPGRSDLVVLGIDPGLLKWEVRWEPAEGGEIFPHLYGPLPTSAVISVHSLST